MIGQLGKYAIRGVLGQGGMGEVLRGWDADLQREVALKTITAQRLSSPAARTRFAREARALARLADSHVVQVHAFEPDHEPPFLVMERLVGDDLRTLLLRGGPFPPARVRDCAWQCAHGLAAAHAAGVLHRDLKPSNVMLCSGGVYKLIDFGLAGLDLADLTATGEVVGTMRYLPPERAQGAEATAMADLWCLGVVLCEIATGRHPFADGPGPLAAGALPPGQPEWFLDWLRCVLDSDPRRRFRDGAEALAALRRQGDSPTVPTAVPAPALPLSGPGPASDETRLLPASTAPGAGSATRAVVAATSRPSRTAATAVPAPRRRRPILPLWLRLTAAIWLVSSAGAMAAGWFITRRAIDCQVAALRTQLIGIAAGAAQDIDPALHARLAARPDPADPALLALRAHLARYASAFPEVRYIYTMAPLPETAETGVVQFVCDASAEVDRDRDGVIGPDEQQAAPGTRYPARKAPALLAGFTQAGADAALSQDQWGSWLSGYAPIRAADGGSAGLVGVDLPAQAVDDLRGSFMRSSALLLGCTFAAFLAAGLLIAWRMRRPVAELCRGMEAVAAGDLTVEVRVDTRDEFAALAAGYNHMREQLRRSAALRTAFDAFVVRTLAGPGARPADPGEGARLVLMAGSCPEEALVRALAAVGDHGGMPERAAAGGVALLFPARHASDLPQERALRAGLDLLAALAGQRAACAVATGAAGAERAAALAALGLRLGQDLLADPAAFTPVAEGFIADLVQERDGGERVLDQAWAVKGAVSA